MSYIEKDRTFFSLEGVKLFFTNTKSGKFNEKSYAGQDKRVVKELIQTRRMSAIDAVTSRLILIPKPMPTSVIANNNGSLKPSGVSLAQAFVNANNSGASNFSNGSFVQAAVITDNNGAPTQDCGAPKPSPADLMADDCGAPKPSPADLMADDCGSLSPSPVQADLMTDPSKGPAPSPVQADLMTDNSKAIASSDINHVTTNNIMAINHVTANNYDSSIESGNSSDDGSSKHSNESNCRVYKLKQKIKQLEADKDNMAAAVQDERKRVKAQMDAVQVERNQMQAEMQRMHASKSQKTGDNDVAAHETVNKDIAAQMTAAKDAAARMTAAKDAAAHGMTAAKDTAAPLRVLRTLPEKRKLADIPEKWDPNVPRAPETRHIQLKADFQAARKKANRYLTPDEYRQLLGEERWEATPTSMWDYHMQQLQDVEIPRRDNDALIAAAGPNGLSTTMQNIVDNKWIYDAEQNRRISPLEINNKDTLEERWEKIYRSPFNDRFHKRFYTDGLSDADKAISDARMIEEDLFMAGQYELRAAEHKRKFEEAKKKQATWTDAPYMAFRPLARDSLENFRLLTARGRHK